MLPDKALGIVRAHIIMVKAFKSSAGFALRTKAEREWFDGGFDVIVENNARFGLSMANTKCTDLIIAPFWQFGDAKSVAQRISTSQPILTLLSEFFPTVVNHSTPSPTSYFWTAIMAMLYMVAM